MVGVGLQFVATAYVRVATPIVIGQGAEGLRRYVPITGGEVQGPLLKGKVLNGGGDLQFVRTDFYQAQGDQQVFVAESHGIDFDGDLIWLHRRQRDPALDDRFKLAG